MADDASYNTFLTRANQDPSSGHTAEGSSTSQARSKFDPSSTSSSNSAIPASLRNISTLYISDTDSEFEPVFFSYAADTLPSVEDFRKVLGAKDPGHGDGSGKGKVERLEVGDWDRRREYGEVVEKVRGAGRESGKERGEKKGSGEVAVFRVETDERGTRIEYYLLTVGERSLVGVVARAVET